MTSEDKHTVSLWRTIFSSFTIIIPFIFLIYFLINMSPEATYGDRLIFGVPFVILGGVLAYIFNRYLACKDQVLEITADNNIFFFGYNGDEKKYSKNDIEKIIIYQPGGLNKIHYFYVYEIIFKDGSLLKFSNMLIDSIDDLFPKDLFTYGAKSPFWLL